MNKEDLWTKERLQAERLDYGFGETTCEIWLHDDLCKAIDHIEKLQEAYLELLSQYERCEEERAHLCR